MKTRRTQLFETSNRPVRKCNASLLPNWELEPVSHKSRNFSSLFRVPQFHLYRWNAGVLSHQTLIYNPLFFHTFKTCQKTSFWKQAGCSLDNWLFGPQSSRDFRETGSLFVTNCALASRMNSSVVRSSVNSVELTRSFCRLADPTGQLWHGKSPLSYSRGQTTASSE